jgi:hypothetical protein
MRKYFHSKVGWIISKIIEENIKKCRDSCDAVLVSQIFNTLFFGRS